MSTRRCRSITGKLELEYEGEMKGGDTVARELIRLAVGKVFTSYFEKRIVSQVVTWFELGGSVEARRNRKHRKRWLKELSRIQGLMEKTKPLGLGVSEPECDSSWCGGVLFIEGLYAHRRISRNEEARVHGRTATIAGSPRESGPGRSEGQGGQEALS